MLSPHSLIGGVKNAIRTRVVNLFNDPNRGERPVSRSTNAIFDPGSVAWRVHGDVASMMVGGIRSLLLQMLQPSVLAGVWDHSNFRNDMHGRLRRTARFIATTTYADRASAEATMAHVRAVHDHVHGTLPDGTAYHANDSNLLAWVHVTETTSFLEAWIRYGEPAMSRAEQDRYFAEMAVIGIAMGASPVPTSRVQAHALINAMRPQLRVDERTVAIARLITKIPGNIPAAELPARLTVQAAVDLLPQWARAMHRLSLSPWERPIIRAGTFGVAQTLRWAFT